MTLKDELERRRNEIRNALSQADRAVVRRAVERLAMLQLVEQSLRAGDTLPDFALPDPTGQIVTTEMLLARGPLVLALFRGPWCPYCELAMRAVERARPAIEALGASVAGTMPAPLDELARVQVERDIGFVLLSDIDNGFARLCGVEYEMTEELAGLYTRYFGADFARPSGEGSALPLPATYVVAPNGRILYAFAHPDWAHRAEPDELVAVVRAHLPPIDPGDTPAVVRAPGSPA